LAKALILLGLVGFSATMIHFFGLKAFLGVPAVMFSSLFTVQAINKRFSAYVASIVLPYAMRQMSAQFKDIRVELLKKAKGKVLDVGCADGQYLKNFAALPAVTSITALEPNSNLHAKLKETISSDTEGKFPVEIYGGFLNDLLEREGERESYDTILLGNVLCEIPEVDPAIAQIRHLLKPGG